MRSIETQNTFPLSSVKPLERLAGYREFCLSATRQRLRRISRSRELSPFGDAKLQGVGKVEGLAYARCPLTGSLFLAELPDSKEWAALLSEVSQYRHSPQFLGLDLSQSRTDHVYAPKLDWIQDTLTLQGVRRPRVLQAVTLPSDLSALLKECGSFAQVVTVDEMQLAHEGQGTSVPESQRVEAAVLLESLDRIDEPVGLLRAVSQRLAGGGLLFITGLVSSGFDLEVLGLKNFYLYPPDRANCFSLGGLKRLIEENGLKLLEVSTPGVLDLEIVQAHLQANPELPLSNFECGLLQTDEETRADFQSFLQRRCLSSFARLVARKPR